MSRGYYRESDSSDRIGRFGGINRFGEERIRHDSYQDDQFKNDYDPTYQDEYGRRQPYQHGGEQNRWSDDLRSSAATEINHAGKGPRGFRPSEFRIHEEACEILAASRELDASDIEVRVRSNCLFLLGEVPDRCSKKLAELLVEDIPGVDDVQNMLRLRGGRYGDR